MRMPSLFASPFRAWFFMGSLAAIFVMVPWVLQYSVALEWQPYHSLYWWHQHEMVYAFALPFILGFLLTASQNWTGESPIQPIQLIAIVLLWVAARIAIALNAPSVLVLCLDLLPLLISATLLGALLIRHKNYRNLIMVFLLVLLALSNFVQILWPELISRWSRFSILLIIFFIVIFGGRVIPFFTAKGLGISKVEPAPVVEKTLLVTQCIATIALPFLTIEWPVTLIAFGLGALHLWRWRRWQNKAIWRKPLLWSLHLAYLLMSAGWLLVALRGLDSTVLHALSVGGIGVMIIAFSGRVSLAHTGRPLLPSALFSVAVLFTTLAAICRVWLPTLFNLQSVSVQYIAAGIFWIIGFFFFVLVYTKIWMKPRQDGRPG